MVTVRVARFNPERDAGLRRQVWQVPLLPGMTVLDVLFAIKEHQDGSLAFRCSCRMGVCGSCGMLINGRPRLACTTQVAELGAVVDLQALPNHDVIKDLVCDLGRTFEKHRTVRPYLIRPDVAEQERPSREYAQTPEEMLAYVQFSYCLKCSLCLAACPTEASTPQFLGPQALAQAYRYAADSRDGGFGVRADVVDSLQGVFGCHLAGACSEACPKGVDPALAIQLLKRALVFGPPHRAPAPVVPARPRTPSAEAAARFKAPPPSV
ncbi:MAG: succinate dehydrogenase iron-sulfur subunit [Armatimonadota bacterium]|nr:succinate dehydrogenase iron-sulfur subunit [Armatimonadota bacterium]